MERKEGRAGNEGRREEEKQGEKEKGRDEGKEEVNERGRLYLNHNIPST